MADMCVTANEPLIMKIIQEAASDAGTWSYAFLRDVEAELVQTHEANVAELVNELVKYMFNSECSPLSRFKIAQFLGCVKMWNADVFHATIDPHVPMIDRYSDVLVGPLSGPTKQLLKKLISPQARIEKPKATSCPPTHTARKRFSFA